jgi:hypothetical protein
MIDRKISIRNASFAKTGLQDFCNYVKEKIGQDIKILEIGAFAGDSTEIFAMNFKEVYSVDPWMNGYDPNDGASNANMIEVEKQYDEVMNYYGNVKKYKMLSEQAVLLFDDNFFDVVYIDALHTYEGCKKDILLWLSKVKETGYISGHDYGSKHFPGVKKAIEESLKGHIIRFNDSSWIREK